MQARLQRIDYAHKYGVLLFTRQADGSRNCVVSMEVENKEEEQCSSSFDLSQDAAQQLMDDLYRAGLRPSDMEDGSGTKLHLADMRKIVASKLSVEL